MIATDHAVAFSEAGTYRDRLVALRLLPSRQAVLLAADWAETVLPILESAYPDDPRPRRAIEAARADTHAAYAAADAAYAAAAYAAADAAATYAAYAADAAYVAATYAAANAAYAAAAYAAYADAADTAANAAYAASHAADWSAVRRLWESAHHAGHLWQTEWRTPLAVELASDPEAYQILLDHLEDQGVPVGGLRGGKWARSNWAVYHLLEGKP